MNVKSIVLVAGLVAGLFAAATRATDPYRESDSAGAPADRHGGDETVWLNAGGQRFAAMIRDSVLKQSLGGVVLLHGFDESPDAPNLILALRKSLPVRGWTSLSLAAPMGEAESEIDVLPGLAAETVGRLAAGVSYLDDRRIAPIAVIGHRGGALMVVRYLAQAPDVKAAVLVNLPDAATEDTEEAMRKIRIPVLDIVTGGANRRDLDRALRRRGLMKDNDRYQQVVIADAGTGLQALEGMLVNRIHGWLKRQVMPQPGGAD